MCVILLLGKGMKLEMIAPKCHKTFSQLPKARLLYQLFPVFKGFSKVQEIHLQNQWFALYGNLLECYIL